jgi:AraC-like DNA-binding protein
MAIIIRRLAFERALLIHMDEIGVDHRAASNNEALRGLDRHERLHRLAGFAIRETGDPLLGVKVGRRVPLADYGALAHAMLSAPTLRHAMRLIVRHMGLVQSTPRLPARITNGKARVYLEYLHPIILPESATFFTDLFLSSLLEQMRRLTDPALKGFEVEVRRRLANVGEYETAIGVPVRDAAAIDRLSAPAELANARLPAAFVAQSDAYLRLAENSLADVDTEGGVARSVQSVLLDRDGAPARASTIARTLGLSERTLRRQLRAEGTSYADQCARARFDLARSYLRSLPVHDVADMLGYHDASTFRRAFRRWSGSTPAQFAASFQAGGSGPSEAD